jgi:lysylphosphatidylglycerol synthetase-like protein (DUF2156 family)
MKRSTSRNLYLIGLVIVIIGLVPFFLAYLGVIQNLSIVALLLAGVALLLVGGLLMLVGYLGALAQVAKLSQWAWFVLLVLFSVITMFIYIFAGPTESKAALRTS